MTRSARRRACAPGDHHVIRRIEDLTHGHPTVAASHGRLGLLDNPRYSRHVNPRRLLRKIADGHLQNVAFRDMRALLEAFGFRLTRVEGSHHIFVHDLIAEQLNLQSAGGDAKPYQIRQFLRLVERYALRMEDSE